MTEPANQFDPRASLPSRHRRAIGRPLGTANSASHGSNYPLHHWTRRPLPGSPQALWPAVDRINRRHRARVWRRRWIASSLVIAVLVALSLGVTAIWLRMNVSGTDSKDSPTVSTNGQVGGAASSTSEDARPKDMDKDKDKDSESESESDSESADVEDGTLNGDSGFPALTDQSALSQKVRPALVTIFQGRRRGTGFVIEGGLVATAYHVAPAGEKATVVFQDEVKALVLEHVAVDVAKDLALLRTDSKTIRQPLRLATSLPEIGTHVAAFKPGGGELHGTVTAIGKRDIPGATAGCDMLRSTLNAVPGWSGGPVVNMDGDVVGVNSSLDGSPFESKGLKIATGSAAAPVTELNHLLAIVKLSEAIRSAPNDLKSRRDRAALYLSNRDFDKAIDDYTEVIRVQPKDAEAYYNRGKAYTERCEYEKAIADYTEAIQWKQDFVDAHRNRAAACEKNANLNGAIADYLELIRLLPKAEADALQPKLVELYRNRATASARERNLDKAIADLSQVIHMLPSDFEARETRASYYDTQGESDHAIADYTEAIRLQPKSADLYRRRGIVRAVKGEHEKAIADFTVAIRLNPKDDEAYCARGAVHGGRHDFKKAVADFTEAIHLNKGLAKAYYDRGMAHKAQGDEAKAHKDLDQAMKLGYRPE